MYQLASCCLLFLGLFHPLLPRPITDSRDTSLQLPAGPEEDARLALEELEKASILQLLPEVLGAETGDGLGEAGPSTNTSNPRGHLRKAFPGEDPNVFLSHLLAKTRKQHTQRTQHGPPLECFWKYCV